MIDQLNVQTEQLQNASGAKDFITLDTSAEDYITLGTSAEDFILSHLTKVEYICELSRCMQLIQAMEMEFKIMDKRKNCQCPIYS